MKLFYCWLVLVNFQWPVSKTRDSKFPGQRFESATSIGKILKAGFDVFFSYSCFTANFVRFLAGVCEAQLRLFLFPSKIESWKMLKKYYRFFFRSVKLFLLAVLSNFEYYLENSFSFYLEFSLLLSLFVKNRYYENVWDLFFFSFS